MENYFNYFTEIEDHFCRRRGTLLAVSTLDWALMETWKQAGVPLEAVLRGIDVAFDHYDRRPAKAKIKKINGLAWCTQEVLAAAQEMKEAEVGSQHVSSRRQPDTDHEEISAFLARNAAVLQALETHVTAESLRAVLRESATALAELAELEKTKTAVQAPANSASQLEEMERHLTVLEEKLLAALTVTIPEADLVQLRAEADREIAPYRSKMPGFQMEQLRKQFVHKRLFEHAKIPRLSLFYL